MIDEPDQNQPVDLDQVRRDKETLRRLLREHPELADRTLALLASEPSSEVLADLAAGQEGTEQDAGRRAADHDDPPLPEGP